MIIVQIISFYCCACVQPVSSICLQLRALYAQHLKRNTSLNKLLLILFKLMPENPVYPGQGPETKESKTFFTEALSLDVES